jgi:deoxyadenosine/deoxycytidine kinase
MIYKNYIKRIIDLFLSFFGILVLMIAEKLNARKVFEDFKGNPFLEEFYEDPDSNALQTQVWFLLQRYQQQQKEIKQLNAF